MKRRQQIRRGIIILSFLSLPITQFYFSPYLIVWGASKGIVTASFFSFAFLLFWALFFGRAFCGWVCPAAGMQETFFLINKKRLKTGKLDYIKFALWIPWLLSIMLLVLLAGGYKQVEYFFHLEHGISVSNVYMFIPYYSVVVLFFVLSVSFGKRASCHYICWISPFMIVGRTLSNLLTLPSLRLQADQSKCVECHLCNKECQMSLDVSTMVKTGRMENAECILCGKCVDICSKHAIKYYWGRPLKSNVCAHRSYNRLLKPDVQVLE